MLCISDKQINQVKRRKKKKSCSNECSVFFVSQWNIGKFTNHSMTSYCLTRRPSSIPLESKGSVQVFTVGLRHSVAKSLWKIRTCSDLPILNQNLIKFWIFWTIFSFSNFIIWNLKIGFKILLALINFYKMITDNDSLLKFWFHIVV